MDESEDHTRKLYSILGNAIIVFTAMVGFLKAATNIINVRRRLLLGMDPLLRMDPLVNILLLTIMFFEFYAVLFSSYMYCKLLREMIG